MDEVKGVTIEEKKRIFMKKPKRDDECRIYRQSEEASRREAYGNQKKAFTNVQKRIFKHELNGFFIDNYIVFINEHGITFVADG